MLYLVPGSFTEVANWQKLSMRYSMTISALLIDCDLVSRLIPEAGLFNDKLLNNYFHATDNEPLFYEVEETCCLRM